ELRLGLGPIGGGLLDRSAGIFELRVRIRLRLLSTGAIRLDLARRRSDGRSCTREGGLVRLVLELRELERPRRGQTAPMESALALQVRLRGRLRRTSGVEATLGRLALIARD